MNDVEPVAKINIVLDDLAIVGCDEWTEFQISVMST